MPHALRAGRYASAWWHREPYCTNHPRAAAQDLHRGCARGPAPGSLHRLAERRARARSSSVPGAVEDAAGTWLGGDLEFHERWIRVAAHAARGSLDDVSAGA